MIYANSKRNLLLGLTFSGALYSTPSIAIIDGDDVLPHDAPYMVYLRDAGCAGVLIAPKTVLTARHCLLSTEVGSEVKLLSYSAILTPTEAKIAKVVKTYENGTRERNNYDDIAIVEIDSMPNGATYLPVAHDEIPLGAEVRPIGYSYGPLRRMPVPATVVAKEHSPDYAREIVLSRCPSSKYFSNRYFKELYPQEDARSCYTLEEYYEGIRDNFHHLPNRYSITVENPPLDESNPRREVNEFGTVTTKYTTEEGDRGGPLIYQGKIYGVNGREFYNYSENLNKKPASFYAGFTRPGVFKWIVDTVKTIQNKPMAAAASSSAVLDVPIVFPRN